MKINGEYLNTIAAFRNMVTVPDCVVLGKNKIGSGHGEAKLYISAKDEMYSFFGGEKFSAKCFLLKSDLIAYMNAIKQEYMFPSQEYAGKDDMPALWEKRMKKVQALDDVIFFDVLDQNQITGPRGYVNSKSAGYKVIRELALPLVSYIYIEKVGIEEDPLFYWKLYVDFDAIWYKKNGPLVLHYGKGIQEDDLAEGSKDKEKADEEVRKARGREGQEEYRRKLLEQCRFCPVTKIADERLLIASHIKPWAASNDQEKVDPYNGYMLSPLIDKLFDKGFITFDSEKRIYLSEYIASYTWKLINLKKGQRFPDLPMDDKRIHYLDFHQTSIFKGNIDDAL